MEQGLVYRSMNLVDLGVFSFFRDFKVVMMNLNDDANKMKYFDGHQAPVLALNVHEEKRWIVRTKIFSNRNKRKSFFRLHHVVMEQ